MGIASVRYLMMPKMANSPNAAPVFIESLPMSDTSMNILIDIIRKMNM